MVMKCLFVTLMVATNAVISVKTAPSVAVSGQSQKTNMPLVEHARLSREARTVVKPPQIYQMHVKSVISNRYATTTVTSKVKNISGRSQETTFSVILPENAFMSGFIMQVKGKNYTGYVQQKEQAQSTYDQAVQTGSAAAHVSTRDANIFTVSVNMETESRAVFYLTYEELLQRKNGHYEQIINLQPGQPVEDLKAEVAIMESKIIQKLKAPPMRPGSGAVTNDVDLDPQAEFDLINDTTAIIRFQPTLIRQKRLAQLLGSKEEEGLSGQFLVQYDVERESNGGEVLLKSGYFAHFFAPTEFSNLPKYIIFVLDNSGSMYDDGKVDQLKDAMQTILDTFQESDFFNIVEFSSNVKVWDLDNPDGHTWYPASNEEYWYDDENLKKKPNFRDFKFPPSYQATSNNLRKAKILINQLDPDGGTNIHDAVKVGLHLVELAKKKNINSSPLQPIIIFLTDGNPTIGITSVAQIITKIAEFNSGQRKTSLYTLAFGSEVDDEFLQKLATRNQGSFKHIYEGFDASLQFQRFFKEVANPILTDIRFLTKSCNQTNTDFPIMNDGSEIVVAGKCDMDENQKHTVVARGTKGLAELNPTIKEPAGNLERLYAYLKIKQLLKKLDITDENDSLIKGEILTLAIQYSFVTPLTSMVVVRPNNKVVKNIQRVPVREAVPKHQEPTTEGYHLIAFSKPPSTTTDRYHLTSLNRRGFNESMEKTKYPWLSNNLYPNETFIQPSGGYRLGWDIQISATPECPISLYKKKGVCRLLNACGVSLSIIHSVEEFVQHFCPLNGYGGVCCHF